METFLRKAKSSKISTQKNAPRPNVRSAAALMMKNLFSFFFENKYGGIGAGCGARWWESEKLFFVSLKTLINVSVSVTVSEKNGRNELNSLLLLCTISSRLEN